MNLLIIGAGGHGKVVAEIAVDCGYEKIDFLDDNSSDAVGKISDLGKFVDRYECAFVGIGNNRFRGELIKKLENCGYQVPVLIHPTAYVSRSAQIEKGTVVEPKTIVNANTKVSLGWHYLGWSYCRPRCGYRTVLPHQYRSNSNGRSNC